jgi:phosphate transport system substrate-binding protein
MELRMKTLVTFAAAVALAACGGHGESGGGGGAAGGSGGGAETTVTLDGAGSTFVNPLMSRWSSEYDHVDAHVRVNYQSIGSGGGIRQLIAHTVKFGATDGPMTDEQLHEAGAPVVHVPLTMGAVVPTYNLPALAHPIVFTPEALAGIYLGHITHWNDPVIASANTDLTLPSTDIVVVHRSDGSGTSYVFTDYLSKVSPEWQTRVGRATSVQWPVGLGGRGNEGIAGTVRQTPGAIGYVELTYALQNGMPAGRLRNRAGHVVEPTMEAVTAAAAGAIATLPDDLRYSITDAEGETAWPISGTTWALVYANMPAGRERTALLAFLRWTLHDGQRFAGPLHYAQLPPELVARAEAKLDAIEAPAAVALH